MLSRIRLAGAIIALILGFYPAATTTRLMFSRSLREHGRADSIASWSSVTERHFDRWAKGYLAAQHAASVRDTDVAATEWPMFGSVFFLLSAEELLKTREITLTEQLQGPLRHAAAVVADPATGTWVRNEVGQRLPRARECLLPDVGNLGARQLSQHDG